MTTIQHLEEIIIKIKNDREAVREQTGAYKYDFAFDVCVEIVKEKIKEIQKELTDVKD